ncbi:MAG: hypothetical protein WAT09_01340 [Paracoccaceae bacterium]
MHAGILSTRRIEFEVTRRAQLATCVAATYAALRDTYPQLPLEQDSLGFAFVEANAEMRFDDANGLMEAIFDLCDSGTTAGAQNFEIAAYILMPKFVGNVQHASH